MQNKFIKFVERLSEATGETALCEAVAEGYRALHGLDDVSERFRGIVAGCLPKDMSNSVEFIDTDTDRPAVRISAGPHTREGWNDIVNGVVRALRGEFGDCVTMKDLDWPGCKVTILVGDRTRRVAEAVMGKLGDACADKFPHFRRVIRPTGNGEIRVRYFRVPAYDGEVVEISKVADEANGEVIPSLPSEVETDGYLARLAHAAYDDASQSVNAIYGVSRT